MRLATVHSGQQSAALPVQTISSTAVTLQRPAIVGVASTINTILLTLLSIGVLVGMTAVLSGNRDAMNGCLPFAVVFAALLWHERNLRSRRRAAWIWQAALSIFGLWLFPLGTALNGAILFYWFSPETRAWFRRE